MNLEKADTILVHGEHWLSRMIQKVTQSRWNHTAMYMGDNLVMQVDRNGVKIYEVSEFLSKDISVFRHKGITQEKADKIIRESLLEVGNKYDVLQIIELFWLYATHQRGTAFEIGSKNRFICSELVSRPYYNNGLIIKDNINASQISPADYSDSSYMFEIK